MKFMVVHVEKLKIQNIFLFFNIMISMKKEIKFGKLEDNTIEKCSELKSKINKCKENCPIEHIGRLYLKEILQFILMKQK